MRRVLRCLNGVDVSEARAIFPVNLRSNNVNGHRVARVVSFHCVGGVSLGVERVGASPPQVGELGVVFVSVVRVACQRGLINGALTILFNLLMSITFN